MTDADRGPLGVVRRLADDVLFPLAIETDRAGIIPTDRLDALASAGLYGMAGPPEAGGLVPRDAGEALEMIEVLAGGCLTTTFVWMQHHRAVRAVTAAAPDIREEWLVPLCRGERRAGIAFSALRRPGPPAMVARPASGGWLLEGSAPWVTGWERIDVLHAAARHEGQIVWTLLDAAAGEGLRVEPLDLAAVAASSTVTVHLTGHFVPDSRVTSLQPFDEWAARDAGDLRRNGSLSLGVARRCCMLLGESRLDAEVDACRSFLDLATPDALPEGRAWASELAVRASSALVIRDGGRSILLTQHAQRLAREAVFLLVFGQTRSIREAQLVRAGLQPG